MGEKGRGEVGDVILAGWRGEVKANVLSTDGSDRRENRGVGPAQTDGAVWLL